jgi:uncharacterized protein YerC
MADSESLPKAEKKSANTSVRKADEFSERRFSETAKNKLRAFVKWLEDTIDAASKPEFLGDRPTDKFDAAREKLRKINDELEVFLSALQPQQRRKVIYVLLDGMAITAEIVSLADRLRAPIWTQDIKLAEMREKKGDPAREKMERLKQALNNIKDEKQMRLSDSEKCASICKAELRRFLEASDMVNGWPGLSTIRKAIRGLGPSLKRPARKK